jgi:tRNA-dihydrouridine synthase B
MQDVTDLPFWRIMHRYGGPDIYFTEYFRVHSTSSLDKPILEAIRSNPANKPIIAQLIGQDIPALSRSASHLQKEKLLAIDLNLGCPAPIVCKKSSGGGMLRNLVHLRDVITALRDAIQIPFTLKTRLGFEDPSEFNDLLNLYSSFPIDALTVHGRTVKEMYRAAVHYDLIAQAVRHMSCPVFANGNILGARSAHEIATLTGAAGLMIGRGAIRNPWIFNQIRELYETGRVQTRPGLRDVRDYISLLYEETLPVGFPDNVRVAKMKKFMNFIAQKIDPDERFLHDIRRADNPHDFFTICDHYLLKDEPFQAETPEGHLVNAGNPRVDCY